MTTVTKPEIDEIYKFEYGSSRGGPYINPASRKL